MDYFQRSLDQLTQDMSSLSRSSTPGINPTNESSKKVFRFPKLNPRSPIFYVYLFFGIFILLLLSRPAIVKNSKKQKISLIKVFIVSVLLTSPWIIWYYYG